jgi:thioredoxin-related protein
MKRVLAIASLLFAAASVFAAEWTEDFAAAKKTAAGGHKDLLIDFTGSDWCGYCMMLDAEVFKKDEFAKVVPEKFVLVKIDSPRDTSRQSAAVREQNTKLSGIYSVEGLPTVVLADAEGRPYATTGYKEEFASKPAGWVDHLLSLRKLREGRDAAFADAAKAEGMEKARRLAKGLKEIDPIWYAAFYKTETDAILAADPDDSLGIREAMADVEKAAMFNRKIEALSAEVDAAMAKKEPAAALKLVDAFVTHEKPVGENLQTAMSIKVDVLDEGQDDQATLKLIDEIIHIAPDTATAADLRDLRKEINE